jgi:heme/copper-type cytochrome/quinol oxidase subunit 1
MGLFGMPRRAYTYADAGALPALNLIATIGAYLMLIAALLFVANIIVSARRRVPAGNDPWDANTLEWATTSPPPEHNFESLPPIRSARPLWDLKHPRSPEAS